MPNGLRISRRMAETADETEEDTLTNETANNKGPDSAVGYMRLLGGRSHMISAWNR